MQMAGTDKFVKVIEFLRRQLHRETLVSSVVLSHLGLENASLIRVLNSCFFFQFVYVNSAFSPNPDELVSDLCDVSCSFHDIL